MLALDDVESPDSACHVHASRFRRFGRDFQSGHTHGEIGGGKGNLDEPGNFLELFFLCPVQRIKPWNFSRDCAIEGCGIEVRDRADAQGVPPQGRHVGRDGIAAGIGRACAIAFAREGATVIATDINEKGIAALTQDGIAETARLDVRNTADVNAFAKRVGKIDILLNAAGFVHHGTIMDCSEEDWDFSFDLNVKSMHRTIRSFLPDMIAGGGGAIVNITSISAVRASTLRSAYGTSKAGLAHLTKQLAVELASLGIRVNGVAPGPVETAMAKAVHTPEIRADYHDAIPLNRYGLEEELAEAVFFLCSDRASYITGQILAVDGGLGL